MVDRVTERTDGVTTERVTEQGGGTTVIERRGGNGAGVLIGLALLILAVVAGYFVVNEGRNDSIETEARTDAIESVGGAVDKIGDAAAKAGDRIEKSTVTTTTTTKE